MITKPANISLRHGGREQVPREAADPAREVSRLLRTYEDASDVTVSVQLPDDHGTLLVALEAGRAFVGLETPDGICQYVADDASEGNREFTTGGAPARIDTRYVLTVPAVIELLAVCLAGPGPFAAPAWETAIICDNSMARTSMAHPEGVSLRAAAWHRMWARSRKHMSADAFCGDCVDEGHQDCMSNRRVE